MMRGIVIAAILASFGLSASAKEIRHDVDKNNGGGRRRKTTIKKMKTTTDRKLHSNQRGSVMDEEDVAFWTRLLVGDRGLQGSMPPSPVQPPSGVTTPIPTPFPTPKPTRRPAPIVAPTRPDTEIPVTDSPTFVPTSENPTYVPTDGEPTACGITPAERRSQIIDKLSVVSFPDLFEQDTPQRDALDWIVNEDGAEICPDDDSLEQRYSLAVFYYSTNGGNWKKCKAPSDFSSQASITAANIACTLTTVNATAIFPNDIRGTNAWLTPGSECLWGGISCYASNTPNSNKVNVVEFENNGLSGPLPTEMEQLDKIRFFALERENLTGPIPSSYGNLKSLLLLDFDFNKLTGDLPSSLWELTNLRQLDLNNNQLQGTLSDDIGNLKQLRFFQIDNNQMVGPIPSALGDVPNFSEFLYCNIFFCLLPI